MSESRKFELTPSISILLAGVIIAGAIVFTNTRSEAAPGTAPELGAAASVPAPDAANDHWYGSKDATTVLIEYSDLQCPYCAQAFGTLKQIVDDSNGSIAWIHRQLPLESIHPNARPSALASECVAEQLGDTGFWNFAATMFANQSKMSSSYYAEVAKSLGADEAQYQSCISTEKFGPRIDTETEDAYKSGATGTPYTVVVKNGKQVGVSGALPYAQFVQVIQGIK